MRATLISQTRPSRPRYGGIAIMSEGEEMPESNSRRPIHYSITIGSTIGMEEIPLPTVKVNISFDFILLNALGDTE
jgi:hypothetical protein